MLGPKKLKTIGNSLETCAPVEKNQKLVGKSTIGLWQENFSSEIPGTSLLFLEVLAYYKLYICTDCFCIIWPLQKTRTNKNCKMLCKNIHNNIFCQELAGNRGYYMDARKYEISLRVLKNISQVSAANVWNIFNTRREISYLLSAM